MADRNDRPGKRKRKGRRARGTGSIFYHEGRGCWVGRGPGGKPEVSGRTQAEVVTKLAAAGPPGPGTTVELWAARWLADLGLRKGTTADYTNSVDLFVRPDLGPVRVADLTAARVEAAVKKWAARTSAATARKVAAHLSAMMSAAVRARLIATNPVRAAKKPRAAKPKVVPYTPAELGRVVAAAGRVATGGILATLAATGCRLGEALGLDVPDLDPAAGTLRISRTFDRRYGLGPPKTERSNRTIEVPPSLLPVVRAAAAGRTSGPLFPSRAGNRQTAAPVWKGWAVLARRLGLPRRKLHTFRHSVATMLISAGWPIGDVAEYLGDTEDTIVKTYLHKTGASPARAIDALLSGGKVGAPGQTTPEPLKIRAAGG